MRRRKLKKFLKYLIIYIIIFLACTLFYTVNWLYETFGNLTLNEVVFQLKVPMKGTNTEFIYNYVTHQLVYIVITSIIISVIVMFPFKKKLKNRKSNTDILVLNAKIKAKNLFSKIGHGYFTKLIVSSIILVLSLNYVVVRTDFIDYMQNQFAESKLIENEFVDVRSVDIEFPENKRNLIYIYLESMESTFYSKEIGGALDENVIKELAELSEENVTFSTGNDLEGSYCLPGTTWTTGAMVAQTMGIPLNIPINGNGYEKYDSFLPGAYSLGQILQREGYNQTLLIGSDASFGGRQNLFEQHGNYTIWDVNSAIEEGKMTESEKVWWGFSDKDLIEYSKEKIIELAQEEEPFNFTMLTVDTHHINGYWCKDCEWQYDEHYYNVLACSSKRIAEFVEWIKEQSFYENTTIVISGDHPSMQPALFDNIEKDGYVRTTVNIFINSAVEPYNTKNRANSTLDLFPSTLASMGAKIEGERLGLGTNLFSEKETLVGKYGLEYVKEEFNKASKFYNKKFIYGE